uniref:SmmA protein n=1 Tax=Rhodococcus rhodochrous TaxID=1829 RepID=A7VJB8_RHORH|nr:smmA [Rhodococcus rhodochrous]
MVSPTPGAERRRPSPPPPWRGLSLCRRSLPADPRTVLTPRILRIDLRMSRMRRLSTGPRFIHR